MQNSPLIILIHFINIYVIEVIYTSCICTVKILYHCVQLSISSPFSVEWHHVGSWKSFLVGIFTPWKLAPHIINGVKPLQTRYLPDVTLWNKRLQFWSSGNFKLHNLGMHWFCPGMIRGLDITWSDKPWKSCDPGAQHSALRESQVLLGQGATTNLCSWLGLTAISTIQWLIRKDVQNEPPQNVPLWHVDYFEPKAIKFQQI